MKITDLLDRRAIDINGKASSKEEAIDKMVELMCKSGKIKGNLTKTRCLPERRKAPQAWGRGLPFPTENAMR